MAQFDIIEQLRLLDTIGGGGTDVLGRAPATPMTNSITPVPGLAEQQQPQNDVLAQLLPESAKLSKTSAITNSLADAINGLLAVSQGRSPGPSNTQRALQQKQEQLNNEFIAKQRQAQEATRKGERAEDKADRDAREARRRTERDEDIKSGKVAIQDDRDWDVRMADRRETFQLTMEEARQGGADEKAVAAYIKEQHGFLSDARRLAIDMKNQLGPEGALAGKSINELRDIFSDSLLGYGLEGELREAAMDFFEWKVGLMVEIGSMPTRGTTPQNPFAPQTMSPGALPQATAPQQDPLSYILGTRNTLP